MEPITRIFDLLEHSKLHFQKDDVLACKQQGEWVKYSTGDFLQIAGEVSKGLIALGIKRWDRVAIMSSNCPEWNFCDFGIMQMGAIQVPMYPTLPEKDIKFILQDAGIKAVFVATKKLYDNLSAIKTECGFAFEIYCFEKAENVQHWSVITTLGKQQTHINIEDYRKEITPEDLLTIIYTSGTTGTPKGVMLTHRNVVDNIHAFELTFPTSFSRALVFLPLSHIFQRMMAYLYLHRGIAIYYAESIDTIIQDIKDIRPDGFCTVPRLLEKIYDHLAAQGSALTGIQRKLFLWALDIGFQYEMDGKNGPWYALQLKLANKIVFKKWREAMGGNIKVMVSGGAALQPRLARVFWAAGMPVLEAYGLTEVSPMMSGSALGKGGAEFGAVGKPLKGLKVKIALDGEVLCKGHNVMKGYYNRPDLTAETIDKDGFLRTGDIGELTAKGFLRITDRKKEIFKTSGGKYVAPQVLENTYKRSPLIEQVMVLGENRRFPAALIVPSFVSLKKWCGEQDIEYTSNREIIDHPRVVEEFEKEVERYNEEFGHWEKVKKIKLLHEEWSVDGGELTPKLSLKRREILEKHKDIIESFYNQL